LVTDLIGRAEAPGLFCFGQLNVGCALARPSPVTSEGTARNVARQRATYTQKRAGVSTFHLGDSSPFADSVIALRSLRSFAAKPPSHSSPSW
jgi:hypothetical protein